MTSLTVQERPLYSVGATNEQVIGAVVLATYQDVVNLASSTVSDALKNAIESHILSFVTSAQFDEDDDCDNNDDTHNATTSTTTAKKKKKKVSKARLRARKRGQKEKRWKKYNQQNDIEVAKFQAELKAKDLQEKEKRYHLEQLSKPKNPYKEYFGHDVRKLYPYSKYLLQKEQVSTLLTIDKDIHQTKQDILQINNHLKNDRLFEIVIPMQRGRDVETQNHGKNNFITNSKSSKLLFSGTMDSITHETEYNQAWYHHLDGLNIWDAVRLGDVPRVEELLVKSQKYRQKVERYKKRGWTPLPPLERDHLNARGVDGQTPLHLVVMMRDNTLHDEIFQLLMKFDANVAAQTIEGYTPLHYCMASSLENMDMLELMLNKADEQKERFMKQQNKNMTVDEKYHGRSLEQLAKNAEQVALEQRTEERIELGVEQNGEPIQVSWTCQKCQHTNPGGVHGVKICGACRKVPSKWYLELELEHRPIDMTTVYGETLTSMAIKSGRRDRLEIVLKHQPDMNRPDESGDTMLMSAVKNNRLDLIQLLLQYGANGNECNYYSETALTYAKDLCLENDDDILMMLTDANGDLPWIKLNMRWMIPEDEWNVSRLVLHEQRVLERKRTNKGSLIKWKCKSKSKRRVGLEHQLPTKFNIDYGTWFGGTKNK